MLSYFAYGANLDRAGMALRCPGAIVEGPARLTDHRFIIMADGYATVIPSPGTVIYGLLWQIDFDDLVALDRFEEVAAGLYLRRRVAVEHRGTRREALIYEATNTVPGRAKAGYMEAVIAAAAASDLPAPYRAELATWLPSK